MNLIIVAGLAGSGKTTVSKYLAKELNATLLDKDPLTRDFTEALLKANGFSKDDRESNFYLTKIRPLEYQVLEKVAKENIESKQVILSAPYLKEVQTPGWLEDFSQRVTRPQIIWVEVEPETLLLRSQARGASRDNWKLANWNKYIASLGNIQLQAPCIRFDNNGQLTERKIKQLADSLLASS